MRRSAPQQQPYVRQHAGEQRRAAYPAEGTAVPGWSQGCPLRDGLSQSGPCGCAVRAHGGGQYLEARAFRDRDSNPACNLQLYAARAEDRSTSRGQYNGLVLAVVLTLVGGAVMAARTRHAISMI